MEAFLFLVMEAQLRMFPPERVVTAALAANIVYRQQVDTLAAMTLSRRSSERWGRLKDKAEERWRTWDILDTARRCPQQRGFMLELLRTRLGDDWWLGKMPCPIPEER